MVTELSTRLRPRAVYRTHNQEHPDQFVSWNDSRSTEWCVAPTHRTLQGWTWQVSLQPARHPTTLVCTGSVYPGHVEVEMIALGWEAIKLH
jgi:hypothetical protein